MKQKGSKTKRSKRPDLFLRTLLADFLRSIPQSNQKAKSIKELLGQNYKTNKSSIETLLVFLKFFNVVKIIQKSDDVAIKSSAESAGYFIKSLAIYIENDLSFISNWEQPGNTQEYNLDNILDWGSRFLSVVEQRRVNKLRSKDFVNEVDVVLGIIKAHVEGYAEPQYLFRLNSWSLRLEMVGGYRENTDGLEEQALFRHICKKLSLNDFKLGKNLKLQKIEKQITNYSHSLQTGAYTKYNVTYYQLFIDKDEIKISSTDQWASIEEMKASITTSGQSMLTPFDNFKDFHEIQSLLDELPLSLSEVQKPKKKKTDIPLDKKDTPVEILEKYIKKGETSNLEFKSSSRWDYFKSGINKDLEKVIVKTISAFLNSGGGTLVVGVSDDGEVLGLQKDMQTLQKKNEDGYMQYLINLISSYIGIEYCAFVDISFVYKEGKAVCIVKIQKAPQPVFLRDGDRREFFVRAGNTSRLLDAEEVYKYIHINW